MSGGGEISILGLIGQATVVVQLVMGRGDQPAPGWALNQPARKQLPAHVIGDPHQGHDAQHHAQHAQKQNIFHIAKAPGASPLQAAEREVAQAQATQPHKQRKGGEVGQAIPVDRKWSQ